MSNTTYNGWSNYETWRVRLEMFDGSMPEDIMGSAPDGIDRDDDARTLQAAMREHAEYLICASSDEGAARDYAFAFISDVNWYEIAHAMLNDWAEEHPEAYAEEVA